MSVNSNVSTSIPSPAPRAEATSGTRWWRAYRGAVAADWATRKRDWRFKFIVGLAVMLAIIAAWLTALDVSQTMADREIAQSVEQSRWHSQGKKNAHSAAHYGIYVFKPVSALAAIEPGIERYVGTTVWLEAHKQNEFVYRPANDKPAASRQLPLTPAFVLQALAPLAMIFLGFGLFAFERERGQLRALRMTAAPFTAIGAARATMLWGAGILLAVPAALAVAIVMASSVSHPFTDGALRAALFMLSYALYLAVWALLIASLSAWATTARTALAVLVAVWAFWALILPRAAVELADIAHPLPSAQAFRETVEKALGEPHDPDVEAKYKAEILAEYGVKDIKDLPVNWSGISMARGEARGDKIFDTHYGQLFAGFSAQSHMMSAFGWMSPAIAVANAGSAAAGSDTVQHLQFVQAAETHRRLIQKMMNDYITANPDRDGQRIDGDEALWRAVPVFTFQFPSVAATNVLLGMGQLVLALLLVTALFGWRCRTLAREAHV